MGKSSRKGAPWGPGISFTDWIESLILRSYPKPKHNKYLEGNYAPVEESGPTADLVVKGVLPAVLNGEYVRNGANPKYEPTYKYHWFDGDGMLHGLRIKDGKATYVCRYVQTSKLKQETKYGRSMFLKVGNFDKSGLYWILLHFMRLGLGIISKKDGEGTANTSAVYHDGRLLALHEGDKPYWVRILEDGNLETMGLWSYNQKLNHPMTAHPKVDAVTGEMRLFGCSFEKPEVQYARVSPGGEMSPSVKITLQNVVMMHDFAITENYSIFMELPLVFEKERVAKGDFPYTFRKDLPARFGVLQRDATSEVGIRFFELPACFIFHTVNAWEDGDEVVLFACRMPSINLGDFGKGDDGPLQIRLYQYRFNMVTGEAQEIQMTDCKVEFPRINEKFVGRRHQYAWMATYDDEGINGVAKVDLTATPQLGSGRPEGGVVLALFSHGPGRVGGEAVFVASDKPGAAEDEGYLMTFVYDSQSGKSELVVIDAKTMAQEPVASVHIPGRIPFGFHGIFISEEQLASQKK